MINERIEIQPSTEKMESIVELQRQYLGATDQLIFFAKTFCFLLN